MNKLALLLSSLVLGLAASAPAAVSYASLGIAGQTNAFIFGNAITNSGGQAEGSVVVGGNWNGSYYTARQTSTTNSPALFKDKNTSIYVGGNATISNAKGLRAITGDVVVAGKSDLKKLDAQKGSAYTASFDLAPTEKNLAKLSSDLFKLDSVAIKLDPKNTNNVKVNLSLNSANKGDLKVYTIDSSILGGGRTLDFSGGTGKETIVINVVGDTVDWGWSVNLGNEKDPNNKNPVGYDDVIWNFANTSTINIKDRAFSGSILAPKATVNQSQNINGTLIANNWTVKQNSNLISHAFTGKIPMVSAPEPAGVLTMGGFLGLALFSRRRQAARL